MWVNRKSCLDCHCESQNNPIDMLASLASYLMEEPEQRLAPWLRPASQPESSTSLGPNHHCWDMYLPRANSDTSGVLLPGGCVLVT